MLSRFTKLRIGLAGALILGLFTLPTPAGSQANPSSDATAFGKVAVFKGEASVNGRPLRQGVTVFEGDRILTLEGKVEIRSGRSKFLIGPHSDIKLGPSLAKGQSYLELLKGTLKSFINRVLFRKKIQHLSFRVKTPTVVVGVRGTEFMVHATERAGLLFNQEGVVSFTAAGETIRVDASHMSQGGEDIVPLEAQSVLAHETLEALLKEVEHYVDLRVPPAISAKKDLNNIIARFNLNYAGYLIDKKAFHKAKKLCDLAFLFADMRDLKSEALLHKATLSFRFLRDERGALEDLNRIIERYGDTVHAEHALYYKGQIHFSLGETVTAGKVLKRYLQTYPQGRFKESARAILGQIPGS